MLGRALISFKAALFNKKKEKEKENDIWYDKVWLSPTVWRLLKYGTWQCLFPYQLWTCWIWREGRQSWVVTGRVKGRGVVRWCALSWDPREGENRGCVSPVFPHLSLLPVTPDLLYVTRTQHSWPASPFSWGKCWVHSGVPGTRPFSLSL